jgi:hypothetical protein
MAEISKQALAVANNTDFPNNNAGAITPAILRSFNTDMIDSTVNQTQYNTNSGSWNVSIGALNTFTSSQQPQFTNLNAFTASQLTINSGYNAATQSLSASIATTNTSLNQVVAFTGSVNQIVSAGILQGYSTRFYFDGLLTASVVSNVGGAIANISLLSDTTRVSTSSFNAYTASTDSSISNLNQFTASQISYNASATASISQLLSFSSSLDNTFATDAQLAAVSASLVVSLDTKLNTSSFNSYTASTNTLLTGYATTGSNSFNGNQVITGSLLISSSAATDLIVTGAMGITGTMTSSGSNGQAALANIALTITSNQQSSSATYGRNIMRQSSGSNAIAMAANPNQGTWVVGVTDPSIITYSGSFASGTYYAPIRFQSGDQYTDGRTTFTTPIVVSGSATITGSITITGSAYGNVISASIVSSTASVDLSKANYFTLLIASNTNINVINPQPGVTATLVINTAGAATASFSSNVKQSSGSFYVPSNSGSVDILSFTAVTTSSVFVIPAYSFV